MTSQPLKQARPAKLLSTQQARLTVDPASLAFKTTIELPDLSGLIGQERAMGAITLATEIAHRGFNLFVLGPVGTGRHVAVDTLLAKQAGGLPVPSDWVYVNNFAAPQKPRALELPAGSADRLKKAMQELVDDLSNDIPSLFESEDYQTRRRALEQEFGEKNEGPLAEFAERARAQNIALLRTPVGFMLTAVRDGNVVRQEDYEKLDEKERKEIDAQIETLQKDLAEVLKNAPMLEKEYRQAVTQLHASMAELIVSARINEVAKLFPNIASVAHYLADVQSDIIENAELFLEATSQDDDGPFPAEIRKFHLEPQFARYVVNVMVSQVSRPSSGAPVEKEDLPTLDRLLGRVEHISQMGTLMTDFTLIQPGALHRANGGYLVLDARRVLSEPYAWDALKRSLQNQTISITSMAERLSLVSTTSLEPDPIPLNVRVVLIGDRLLHFLLVMYDPDFDELFKLQADFEEDMPRSKGNLRLFARLIATVARRDGLRPLKAKAVARLLDEAARLAEDTKRLSLQIGALNDLMREADHYAGQRKSKSTDAEDIEQAIQAADRRKSRIRDRMQGAVARKTIMIDTAGESIGQINGLSVVGLGNYQFGRASRITARVRMGSGKLVDIEREVELGGPLHSKGVMILGGYLTSTYALDVPFSLHASLVFEQSYGGIDGDSASSAELYALLSALSEVPIQQGLAVTGSVNQAGQVQAIGGVNEKIEGFFDTCKVHRLTGNQGVLIPKSNVPHLMLRPDVAEAVGRGEFRIIPVATINQGMEALTGIQAGKRGKSGKYPGGTVNNLIENRLRAFAENRRKFASKDAAEDKGK